MSILGYSWSFSILSWLKLDINKNYQKKEVGRERICKEFLEKTDINLSWEPFRSKYDILRNMYGSYKRPKNFTGVSADDNTLIEMNPEWWDDREKVH